MIRDHDDLRRAQERIAILERILIDSHRRLGSKDHPNYSLYTRRAIEFLLEIRGEIDEFLGIAPSPPRVKQGGNGTHVTEDITEPAAT